MVYDLGQRTGLGGESFRSQHEVLRDVVPDARESTYRAVQTPQHFVTAVFESEFERKQDYDAALERGDLKTAQAKAIGFLGQVAGARVGVGSVRATPGAFAATPEGILVPAGGTLSTTPSGAMGSIVLMSGRGNDATVVQENTPSRDNPSPVKLEPAIKERQRQGAARERATQVDLELEHPQASVQREQLLRDAMGKKVKDPLTETGRRVDHVVIECQEVVRSVETTSLTADKAAQVAKEQRVRQAGGNYVRDRRTGQLVPIQEEVKTEVIRRE